MIKVNDMNPVEQIAADRDAARQLADPNADVCFLATSDANGQAHVRTLVLRDIVDNRFGVYLSRTSPKWKQLAENDGYELLLFYPTIARQYRLSGTVQEIESAIVTSNWHMRPAGSKYMDYFYREVEPQSSSIESRQALISGIDSLKTRFPNPGDLHPSDLAAGLDLVITSIDRLDISDPDRIHDRIRYSLRKGNWVEQVLVP
jgi:pyridoxine/pyridoxamine 5'-phosphate oxidase